MSTTKIFVYNPAQKTKEQLIAEFVIRQDVFEKIMKELRSADKTTPPQAFLLAGQRGMGKTTLLLRIKYAIEDDPALNRYLIPVRFSEEQYNIGSLERLWEETAIVLENKNPLYQGLYDEMIALEKEKDYANISFDILEKRLKKNKQRALLMIDNIGDLFDKFSNIEHHRLREILMTSPHLQIIGSSARVMEHTFLYEQPFFEFFHEIKLKPLDEKATHALLRALAKEYGGVDRIEDLIQNNPGRIDALRKLTGGVPRIMVLLFEIFVDETDGSAFEDLGALLENVNSFYKHRMDELKPQQQQIMDALARAYEPITAAEVLDQSKLYRTGLQTNQISSQLNQLTDNQLVEAFTPKGRTKAYSIRERFFNIWYLMRHGRKQNKEEVRWLIHFFEVWYNVTDLKDLAKRQIDCMRSGKYSPRAAYYKAQALHGSAIDADTKAELMAETSKFLLSTNNREWAEVIKMQWKNSSQPSFIQKTIKAYGAGNIQLAQQYAEESLKNREPDAEIMAGYFYYLSGNKMKAEDIFAIAPEPLGAEATSVLGDWFRNKKDYVRAEEYYLKAAEKGDIDAMYNLANLYWWQNKNYIKAEEYYLKAIEKGQKQSMYNLAILYENEKKDYLRAEEYYLKAIEWGHVSSMYNLAILYGHKRKDFAKAEEYYIKAVEKGHKRAMLGLAILYEYEKKDYDKALYYYQKALETGNEDALIGLGTLYEGVKKDYDKAEYYYLEAFKKGKGKGATMDLILLHDAAKRKLPTTINYFTHLLFENPHDTNALFLLTCMALTDSDYSEAFKHATTFLNLKEAYEDLENVIRVLEYLLERKQYHFLLNQFKQENGLLMLHAKPYYYALAWFMRDELPGEFEKTPGEMKETVQEIIKLAAADEKEIESKAD